jgi:hypothetical protein
LRRSLVDLRLQLGLLALPLPASLLQGFVPVVALGRTGIERFRSLPQFLLNAIPVFLLFPPLLFELLAIPTKLVQLGLEAFALLGLV